MKQRQPDEQEFTRLVHENKSTIYTVCYMFSKDNDEVNDLFQETLINLWRGFGGSLWLGLAWSALLLASVASDWYVNRTDPRDWLKENLTATARKLLRMKTLRRRAELAAIPLAIALVAWMCFEAMQEGMSAMAQGFVVGGLLGGIIGGAIGFTVYRRMQRTNDYLIREIEELTQD